MLKENSTSNPGRCGIPLPALLEQQGMSTEDWADDDAAATVSGWLSWPAHPVMLP